MRFLRVLSIFLLFSILMTSVAAAGAGDVWIQSNDGAVFTNSTFDLEVRVNSGMQKLGAYQFTITFDKNLVTVDTSKGTDGVEAGSDGFIAAVNTNNSEGSIIVNGFNTSGTGPGSNLRVLILHFKALGAIGTATIGISVSEYELTDESGIKIGNPSGQGTTVAIQQPYYSLSVSIIPAGGGNVKGTNINCPNDCSDMYDEDAEVTLTATASSGYQFDHWSGCGSSNGSQCSLTMNSDKSVKAYFNALPSSLSLPLEVNVYSYLPIEEPVECSNQPALCKPLSVGNVSNGTLNLKVSLPLFSNPVDVYIMIYAPQIDNGNIYLFTPENSLQPLSAGLIPWLENTSGGISTAIVNLPTSDIAPSIYYLYLIVTPTGSTGSYYLWTTYFVMPVIAVP